MTTNQIIELEEVCKEYREKIDTIEQLTKEKKEQIDILIPEHIRIAIETTAQIYDMQIK